MEKLFSGHMRRQVEDRIFKMSIPELIEVVKVAKMEDGIKKKISGFIVNKVRQNAEEDTLKEIYFHLFKSGKVLEIVNMTPHKKSKSPGLTLEGE